MCFYAPFCMQIWRNTIASFIYCKRYFKMLFSVFYLSRKINNRQLLTALLLTRSLLILDRRQCTISAHIFYFSLTQIDTGMNELLLAKRDKLINLRSLLQRAIKTYYHLSNVQFQLKWIWDELLTNIHFVHFTKFSLPTWLKWV